MMRSPAVENEFIPCLADAMRHWLASPGSWLQYLPAALCCVWALFYFWRRRAAWDWITNGSPLMLVSLLAAPYCWLYDQCLAIPALLDGAYATRSRKLLACSRAADSRHGYRNLLRPGHLAALALDRARMACLVSLRARLSRKESIEPAAACSLTLETKPARHRATHVPPASNAAIAVAVFRCSTADIIAMTETERCSGHEEGARLQRSFDRDCMRCGGCLYHSVSQHPCLSIAPSWPGAISSPTGPPASSLSIMAIPTIRPPSIRIERDAGFQGGASYYMRNAPWALPLALPLGYFGAQAAALPWSLLMLGLLIASVRMLWKLFGRAGSRLDWLGYCFPPALFCVILGQTSILLLFGLVLFLRLHKTRPFAAGAALWFCTLKPHLFLPFALCCWCGSSSRAAIASWLAAWRPWRRAWPSPRASTPPPGPSTRITCALRSSRANSPPCLGDVLRDSINPSAEWLAFVPCASACIWALAYFWPRRHTWDWLENGSPLMLVSLFVAPFGWIFDQSLAIPAILYAVSRNPSRIWLAVLALIYILIEIESSPLRAPFGAFLWTAPAWLVWYLFARASARKTVAPVVAA